MDEFAVLFQRFTGTDTHAIPKKYLETLAEHGIRRCSAKGAPCFIDPDAPAAVCACMQKMRRWSAFWKVVKLDLDGEEFPQLISETSTTAFDGPYHRPIFTHVCPLCRRREESYGRTYTGLPTLGAAGWTRVTIPAKPIHVMTGSVRNQWHEVSVCQSICAKEIQRQNPAEWGDVVKLWTSLDRLDEREMLILAAGYDIPMRFMEKPEVMRTKLRMYAFKHGILRESTDRLARAEGAALDRIGEERGVVRWYEETDARFRARISSWAGDPGPF